MRALVLIGEVERQQIAKLRALAAENEMDPEAMNAAAEKDIDAYRAMMVEFTIELPVGFLVTYTNQRQPIGSIQQISISVEGLLHNASRSVSTETWCRSAVNLSAAVNMILDAFGMRAIDQSLKVWIEDVAPTEKAINVVQWLVS